MILRAGPLDELARLRFDLSAVIVAVELATNSTYAAQAIIEDNVRVPAYDGPPLEGMSGEAFTIDLHRRLELPWRRGAFLISATGPDIVTSFSASATSLANVGPGLGSLDHSSDFLAIPALGRGVAMIQMLLGRLEIYPVILALSVVTLRGPNLLRRRAS